MMGRIVGQCLVTVICAAAVGCSVIPGTSQLKQLQRVQSGGLNIVLLARNEALKMGKDEAVLEFRRGLDNQLIDVGTVKVNASMPMAGMSPMLGGVVVMPGDAAGRYTVQTDLTMAGSWRLTVEWQGPAGRGMASLIGPVR